MVTAPPATLQFHAWTPKIGAMSTSPALEVRHARQLAGFGNPDVWRAAAADIQAANRGSSLQSPRHPQSASAGKLHTDRRELAAASQRPDRVYNAAPADRGLNAAGKHRRSSSAEKAGTSRGQASN